MKYKLLTILVLLLAFSWPTLVNADNIDPDNDGSQYAYGENVGWFNFQPNQGPGVQVSSSQLEGFVWQENIGWINLYPNNYGGVANDGAGNLSGYAWGENVGWINFSPNYGGVSIDTNGNFDGWAWGENIGWIHLSSASPVPYGVKVCKVDFDDLMAVADDWMSNPASNANLNGLDDVDLFDFAILAGYWLDYCPTDWPL